MRTWRGIAPLSRVAIPCAIAPSSHPECLPLPHPAAPVQHQPQPRCPCSAWFRGAPAGRRGARGARQAPRASMAVGGGVRPGGRREKGRLDFLYVPRHVVLTIPDALRMTFFHDRSLLADLMQCGVKMLGDALSWFKKCPLEAGCVVVLETGGRAGNWNPHLHILMTSGGVTPQHRWLEVGYFPFEALHKKWQYHLFTMLKARVGSQEMRQQIDVLWRKYQHGLVAYLEKGKVPAGGQGLAYYLAKYVVSPPISLRRILHYDGQRVRYWYRDHKTGKRQVTELPVVRFIGRLVQHILPKGFHRIRYYGLHATCKPQRVRSFLTTILVAMGRAIKGTYRVVARKTYRERVLASTGCDPLRCPRCGGSMMLWKVWHPRYGVMYDELQQIKRGRYDPGDVLPRGEDVAWERRESVIQLGLSFMRIGDDIRGDHGGFVCCLGLSPS